MLLITIPIFMILYKCIIKHVFSNYACRRKQYLVYDKLHYKTNNPIYIISL